MVFFLRAKGNPGLVFLRANKEKHREMINLANLCAQKGEKYLLDVQCTAKLPIQGMYFSGKLIIEIISTKESIFRESSKDSLHQPLFYHQTFSHTDSWS